MIIYQFCLLSLAPFPYLPALLDLHDDDDDDVGCSQTGHVGSGFGTCRRARGARRIVSACARLFISSCLPFPTLCVCDQVHIKQSPEDDHFSLFCTWFLPAPSYIPPHSFPSHLPSYCIHFPRLCWRYPVSFFTGKSWSLKKSCVSSVTTSSPWKCPKRRYPTRFRDLIH